MTSGLCIVVPSPCRESEIASAQVEKHRSQNMSALHYLILDDLDTNFKMILKWILDSSLRSHRIIIMHASASFFISVLIASSEQIARRCLLAEMRATSIAAIQRKLCTFQSTRAAGSSLVPKHPPTDIMDKIDGVLIRPIGPRDVTQASQIWVQGLKQTSDSRPEERRAEIESFFRDYARKELEEGGGIGPDGMGLIKHWHHDPAGDIDRDCRMFVAVRKDANTEDGERDTKPSTPTVLGLVGVKRGMDSKEYPTDASKEDYSVFSIWKMSVSEDARGLGVGRRLMAAAEQWAKGRPNAKVMRLYTGNPIAAKFYTSEKVGYEEIVKEPHYGTYEKKL